MAATDCIANIDTHLHCNECYQTRLCNHTECPLISCPENCGAQLHMCKVEDHLNICCRVKVECINVHYGCPAHMMRYQLSAHLNSCPASVLQCGMQRQRRTIGTKARSLLKKAAKQNELSLEKDFEQLPPDLSLAFSDQNEIMCSFKIKRSLRKKVLDFYNRHNPVLPIHTKVNSEKDENKSNCAIDSSEEEREAEKEKNKNKMTPKDPSRECRICQIDPASQHLHTIGNSPIDSNETIVKKKNWKDVEFSKFNENLQLFVNLAQEFLSPTIPKSYHDFTLSCDSLIRRDQYFSHYQYYHTDIIKALDGWQVQRCPLAEYGCLEWQRRLTNKNTFVHFNMFTNNLNLTAFSKSDPVPQIHRMDFTKLPAEVMILILSYMDSNDIYCISATCKTIRSICKSLLMRFGIVHREWISMENRNGRNTWIRGPKVSSATYL